MKPRIKMKFQFVFVMSLVFLQIFLVSCKYLHYKSAPTGLITDLLLHPEDAVITNNIPMFSWIVNGRGNGVMQTAYQILVASDFKSIKNDSSDVWDSGKVNSDQSVAIVYKGNSLEENTSYWWKVRTWDQNNEMSGFSDPQRFNTGNFYNVERNWPGESRWVKWKNSDETQYVFENRHPIRFHDIPPVSIIKNPAGNHFITFENAYFATLKLTLNAPESVDSLVIHLGEKLAPGNQVDRKPGGSISYQKVKLPLRPGKHEYIVELPRYYAGRPNSQVLAEHLPEVTAFRYAEIEGWPETLKTDQVCMHALLYHFNDKASYFYCSDQNLNQIWELCKHSLKVEPFMGVYIDNGTRERMPYEAESYMQQLSHYCVDREFAIQRYTINLLLFNTTWPTEWSLQTVLMAWDDYMATGDARFLENYYDELKKKTLLPLAREDGLISTRTGLVTKEFLESIHLLPGYLYNNHFSDIVDWPIGTPANETKIRTGFKSASFEGETDRYIFSDINTVVNAFHYRNLVLMAKIANLLGKTEDEAFFKERSVLLKTSFNKKLLDKESGLYIDGEGVDHSAFHANFFPVAFGLAPVANYPELRKFLISKGMACSPIKALHLFDALYELGAEDYALELLTSETDRSWMNMIRFGSTGVSEAWDIKYKNNMAWIQPGGATPTYIISRKIFGIEPLEPSFRRILIRPRPGALEFAEIKSPTIRGPVYVKFKRKSGGVFKMKVIIPGNTYARLMLPKPNKEDFVLKLNGKEIPVNIEDGSVLIDNLVAGRYLLEIK